MRAIQLTIDFYTVESPPSGPPMERLLRDAAESPPPRRRDVNKSPVQLVECGREAKHGVWIGEMARIRLEEGATVRSASTGEARAVELEEDEGLSHETAFLYDPKRSILAIQRNRSGVSASRWAAYFERDLADGGVIELVAILTKDATERLERSANFSKLEVAVEGTLAAPAAGRAAPSAQGLAEIAGDLGCRRLVLTASMARRRNESLRPRRVREFIRRLLRQHGPEIKKLVVSGKSGDGATDVIDLIAERLVARHSVQPGPDRTIPYAARSNALLEAWMEHHDDFPADTDR